MKQSPILEFQSSAFPVVPGEDEATHPGVYGRALAEWLADRLRGAGVRAGKVVPEDFGWLVPIEGERPALFVACANADGTQDRWRVFAFAEGGLVARLRDRKRNAALLASLFASVKGCLEPV